MQPCQGFRQALVVACQTPETSSPCETALHNPTAWQQYEASFCVGQLDHFQPDALPLGSLRRLLSGVACIYIRYLHVMSGRLLHGLGQLLYLCSIPLVGRGYPHSEQVSQRVYGDVYLAPLLTLGSIVPCSCSTLRRRLHRAAIKDNSS